MDEVQKQPSWVDYLEHDVLGREVKGVGTVYAVTIQVKLEGLLAIVKVRGGGGYYVGFEGGGSFASLAGKVRARIRDESKPWKPDEYKQI